MLRLSNLIALILITVICAGCASTPNTVAPEVLNKYKSVGVVSVTAQRFTRQHVGITVFGNESERMDSAAWDIDSAYEQQVRSELESIGGFEVIQATTSGQEFLRINDLNGPWDAMAFREANWDAIEEPIRNYCTKNGVTAIVFVFEIDANDFIGRTNQFVRGAGIYTHGFSKSPTQSYLHLISGVGLVDCMTAKPLAVRVLSESQKRSYGDTLFASPRTPLSLKITRTPLEQLSTQQVAEIKERLISLPSAAWAPTLRALLGR